MKHNIIIGDYILLVVLAESLLDLDKLSLGSGDESGARGTEHLGDGVSGGLGVLRDTSGHECLDGLGLVLG